MAGSSDRIEIPKEDFEIPDWLANNKKSQQDCLREVLDYFSNCGVDTKPTRLPKYQEYLQRYDNEKELYEPSEYEGLHNLDLVLYAIRETQELHWIVQGFKASSIDVNADMLKPLVSGKDFARYDKDKAARNLQFEYRIASYFLQQGYAVNLDRICDIEASLSGVQFYIECKRVTSDTKLTRRMKDANKQLGSRYKQHLAKSNVHGIIAIDVTGIAYPHQGSTWGFGQKNCREVIQKKLNQIRDSDQFDKLLASNKRLLGIWLQIHVPSTDLVLGLPHGRFSSLFIRNLPYRGARAKAFSMFDQVFTAPRHG